MCIDYNICFIWHILENLKHSNGQYTDNHVKRCSQIVGQISGKVNEIMHVDITGIYEKGSKRTEMHFSQEVKKFVTTYKRDKLWDVIPGRQHSSFPQFVAPTSIARPAHLKARVRKHSRTMDIDYRTQEVLGLGWNY